jgi:O-antigen/teichoic acid export membrane protein
MKGKIMEVAVVFFIASLLIYLGAKLLIRIWGVLVIVVAVLVVAVIAYRIWRFKRY